MKAAIILGAVLTGVASPAQAVMPADHNSALLGMLRGVFVHERCTGRKFSVKAGTTCYFGRPKI